MNVRLRMLCTSAPLLTALVFFRVALSAQVPVTLYNFTGGAGGYGPYGLALGVGGVLYGVSTYGGTAFTGTAFSLTPPASSGGQWTPNIYSFPESKKIASPFGTFAVAGPDLLFNNSAFANNNHGSVFALFPPHPGRFMEPEVALRFCRIPE